MENPIKMDDLGVPLFLETPIYICYRHIFTTSQAELHRLCVNLQGGQRRLVMGLGAKGKGVKPLMESHKTNEKQL